MAKRYQSAGAVSGNIGEVKLQGNRRWGGPGAAGIDVKVDPSAGAMAGALGDVAKSGLKIALAREEENDMLQVQKANTEYRNSLLKMLYDPNEGWYNQRKGDLAQNMTTDFEEVARQRANDIRATLKLTDKQSLMFDRVSLDTTDTYYKGVMQFETEQGIAMKDARFGQAMTDLKQTVMEVPFDDYIYESVAQDGDREIALQMLGRPREVVMEAQKKWRQDLETNRLTLLAYESPNAALAKLETSPEFEDGQERLAAKEALQGYIKTRQNENNEGVAKIWLQTGQLPDREFVFNAVDSGLLSVQDGQYWENARQREIDRRQAEAERAMNRAIAAQNRQLAAQERAWRAQLKAMPEEIESLYRLQEEESIPFEQAAQTRVEVLNGVLRDEVSIGEVTRLYDQRRIDQWTFREAGNLFDLQVEPARKQAIVDYGAQLQQWGRDLQFNEEQLIELNKSWLQAGKASMNMADLSRQFELMKVEAGEAQAKNMSWYEFGFMGGMDKDVTANNMYLQWLDTPVGKGAKSEYDKLLGMEGQTTLGGFQNPDVGQQGNDAYGGVPNVFDANANAGEAK